MRFRGSRIGVRAQGLGFRDYKGLGLGFRASGSGNGIWGSRFTDWGLGLVGLGDWSVGRRALGLEFGRSHGRSGLVAACFRCAAMLLRALRAFLMACPSLQF